MFSRRWQRGLGALVALAALAACSDEPTNPAPTCPADDVVRGVCAGVPPADVCGADACTAGVSCARVVSAASQSELDAAITGAQAGTCITLAPGSYGAAKLPGGVSLLGRSAAAVSVAQVSVGAGQSAVVRGLAIGGGGLAFTSAAGARVEAVRITGDPNASAPTSGVLVDSGSKVTLVQSEIRGASGYGLEATDGADVTLDRTVVSGSQGPGIWAACSGGCGTCASPPTLSLLTSVLYDNRIAGVALSGAVTTIDGVDIKRTKVGDKYAYGQGGGGLSVASCSTLDAKRLRVLDGMGFGALIDESNAQLGGDGAGEGFEVSGNLMGVWIQNISKSMPQNVHVEQGLVTANRGVGIAISGEAHGILVICKTAVTGTTTTVLPVFDEMNLGAQKEVGDGLNWLDASEVTVQELTLSGNARKSLLIDGAATGTLKDVVLSGGDDQKGILQQNYGGGAQPQRLGSTPPIVTAATRVVAIPKAPAAPAKLP